ncbi:type IV pilin protein [Neisseria leonii]|uniref:type IV pilin protein n=1 Tax=Neisseria leonii TaxID=2995413 RepID=UPI00237B9E20|nr:type IV pilin protein [Neisseria sp. 3986]MDD9326384.1 pilin [Neisseria sp. 3986]
MSVPEKSAGFTLPQMMVALLLAALFAAAAWSAYGGYARDARLNAAHGVLLDNARFLNEHYLQHLSYKAGSTTWPVLPVGENADFCFRLQGNPRGALADRFTLKAVAKNPAAEGRVLLLNQDLTATVCESSTSSCDETTAFFGNENGTDRQCSLYRP